MLQATFCPFMVSSTPLTRSGAVSNRMWTSAHWCSLSIEFENAAGGRQELISLDLLCIPLPIGHLKDCAEKIGQGLIGTNESEVSLVQLDDIS